MQTAMVWSCFPFIRSVQNHLARHGERGKKTRQTEEEVGRQHQGMDRPGVRQVPEGSEEQGKMEKTGCKIICGAPTTLAVKGLMMMMMVLAQSHVGLRGGIRITAHAIGFRYRTTRRQPGLSHTNRNTYYVCFSDSLQNITSVVVRV